MTKNLKLALLGSIPMLLTLLLAVFFMLPKHVGSLSGVMPMLHLAPVFLWSVMHPRDMPFLFLALLGLVLDVATGLPLGMSALTLLSFSAIVRTQRKYIFREGFSAMWAYYTAFVLLMQGLGWLIYSFGHGVTAPLFNPLMQWLLTALSYPILHFLMHPLVDKLATARYRLLHA